MVGAGERGHRHAAAGRNAAEGVAGLDDVPAPRLGHRGRTCGAGSGVGPSSLPTARRPYRRSREPPRPRLHRASGAFFAAALGCGHVSTEISKKGAGFPCRPTFDPLGESADPRRYVPLATSERILSDIAAKIRESASPILLAGPSGVGKTLILHVLGEHERLSGQRVVYSPFLHLDPDECARWLLHLLGIASDARPAEARLLEELSSHGSPPTLLLVDEIQAAPEASVRKLAELAKAGRPVLTVVAAGSEGRHAPQADPRARARGHAALPEVAPRRRDRRSLRRHPRAAGALPARSAGTLPRARRDRARGEWAPEALEDRAGGSGAEPRRASAPAAAADRRAVPRHLDAAGAAPSREPAPELCAARPRSTPGRRRRRRPLRSREADAARRRAFAGQAPQLPRSAPPRPASRETIRAWAALAVREAHRAERLTESTLRAGRVARAHREVAFARASGAARQIRVAARSARRGVASALGEAGAASSPRTAGAAGRSTLRAGAPHGFGLGTGTHEIAHRSTGRAHGGARVVASAGSDAPPEPAGSRPLPFPSRSRRRSTRGRGRASASTASTSARRRSAARWRPASTGSRPSSPTVGASSDTSRSARSSGSSRCPEPAGWAIIGVSIQAGIPPGRDRGWDSSRGRTQMKAPLEGVRVIEIAHFVAVPAAGSLLADLGADVIKIEVPPRGEIYRRSRPAFSGYAERLPGRPRLPPRQPRQALADARPHQPRRAQRAAARDRRRRRRHHEPAAGAPREVRPRSRDAARAQAEPRRRRHQRLRARRRRGRSPRLRLRRLLGAQRHDGPDARRGRAAVDAAPRRRRPRGRVEPRDRDPRRAAHARRDRPGPLRRSVAAPDGALHPRLRRRDGARRARADHAATTARPARTRSGTPTRWRAAAGSCS